MLNKNRGVQYINTKFNATAIQRFHIENENVLILPIISAVKHSSFKQAIHIFKCIHKRLTSFLNVH
jgi:hypothetical protein